jgi:DNA repair protein RadA/Sms
MARRIEIYLCTACDGVAPQWVGRCPHCGQWNTLTTAAPRTTGSRSSGPLGARDGALAVSLRQVDGGDAQPMPTGVVEVDRVLGGGFVSGSVTLVFGPPGVGKSTLLFQVLASVAVTGADVLLASAEESLSQVSVRAARIGAVPENLLALAGPDVVAIEAAIVRHRPALVVVDSIQTVADDELPGAAGSLAQVRACVDRLTRLAKSTGVPVVLVGHVTKATWPAPGPSSTWSTRCSPSTATGIIPCGC